MNPLLASGSKKTLEVRACCSNAVCYAVVVAVCVLRPWQLVAIPKRARTDPAD